MSEVMKVPDGWGILSLSQIGTILTGNTPPTDNEEYYNGNIPFIGPVDFNGQKYIVKSEKHVSKKGLDYSREIPSNTIITVCIGSTIGKLALTSKASCTNQQINSLTCKKAYSFDFVFYSMSQYLQRQLDVEAGLQAVPIVNKTAFSKLNLLCPVNKCEQQKIAKILSTLDKTIEATQKLIDKEKNIKKGLMHDLLTNGIDSNGKIRTPQTHTYKQSKFGLIPEDWEMKTLDKCASITNSNVDKKYLFDEKEVKLCNYMDVYSNEEIDNSIDFMIATASNLEIKKFLLQKNDVIITKDSELPDDIGISTYIKENLPNVLCGYHLALIRPKKNCDGRYLSLLLQSNLHKKYFGALASGSTRFALSLSTISNTPIALPLKYEQKQIAKSLTTQEKKIQTEETTLVKLKELKKGLMQDLLSGKMRVKVWQS